MVWAAAAEGLRASCLVAPPGEHYTSQSSAAGQQTKERPMQQRRRGVQRWFVAAGSAAVRNWQTKAQVESNLAEAWAVVSRAASLACVDKLPSQYTGKQHIAC